MMSDFSTKRWTIAWPSASRAFSVTYVYSNLLGNDSGRICYDGGALIASQGKLIAAGPRFGLDGNGNTCTLTLRSRGSRSKRRARAAASLRVRPPPVDKSRP